MTKRTTLILDDEVYKRLVAESIERYGTAKNISKVVNDLVRKSRNKKDKRQEELLKLIYSKKIAKTTATEFENFRRKLSSQMEQD